MTDPNQLPSGVPEHFLYKSRLQQYVQKLSLPLPVYQTYNEGVPHAPLFRATVVVDNTCYTSRNLFTNIKSAEQDIAKVALDALLQKINDEGSRFIHEDTTFCKAVLNEYATKLHLDLPTYRTSQQQGVLPAFSSSLVFNGVTFTGQVARSKKDAEQLAARAAILSIMGNPGPDSAIISNIVKSKYRPLLALYNVNSANNPSNVVTPMLTDGGLISGSSLNKGKEIVTIEATSIPGPDSAITSSIAKSKYRPLPALYNANSANNPPNVVTPMLTEGGLISGSSLNKGKEIVIIEATSNVSSAALVENRSSQVATILVPNQPFHEFKKPKLEPIAPVTPPIAFVPPVLEQSLGACPTSAKKRRKKGSKNHQPIVQPVVPSGGVISGKENVDTGATCNPSSTAVGEKRLRQAAFIRIVNQPFRDVEKPTIEISPSEAIPPSMFVPPVLEQPSGAGPSGTKKRRKKGKTGPEPVAQFRYPVGSTSQIPCSISR